MSHNEILRFQLFAEDGAAAEGDFSTGDAATTAEGTETGADTGEGAPQDAPAEGDGQEPSGESWESLIKGKYKKEYGRSVQQAVFKRMKNHQAERDALDPIVRGLAQKYGIRPNPDGGIPIEAVSQAFLNDNAQYEKEAYERGMSVDDLRQMKQLERENERLRQAQAAEENNRYWSDMERQAEDLKETFPDLDFAHEMENPEFAQQLAFYKGADPEHSVERAYRNVHFDEIMSGMVAYTANRVSSRISRAIQSGSRRPAENGSAGGTSTGKAGAVDPSKLTQEQIADINRRAQRGERITF